MNFLILVTKLLNVKIIMLAFKNITMCVQNILFYQEFNLTIYFGLKLIIVLCSFFGKTLNSHSASFQKYKWVPAIKCWG